MEAKRFFLETEAEAFEGNESLPGIVLPLSFCLSYQKPGLGCAFSL
jgi:hypothetical protein